ncbi:MAG: adenylosuccinate synthetase, partial [Nanoarchaeota archaeon]|nr:adenylosuccinate synthetase [Nanoarchaeota archaeon]
MTTHGKSTVLIGLQYGDEGKARVMDTLLKNYDIVARFNGGANAGHTLKVGDVEIALHQIPSGIFYKDMMLYVGSGCVVNPEKVIREIEEIQSKGLEISKRLFISGYATLIQPHHLLFDEIYGKHIGSTKNGIGPAYADRAMRAKHKEIKNIRFGDYLADPDTFKEMARNALTKMIEKHGVKNLDADAEIKKFHENVFAIKDYLCHDPLMIENLIRSGKNIFFEGAQSVMLDVVTGMTPFVTSSRTIAAAAYTGGDLSIRYHEKTLAVAKAIMSRVGNGPFVSEFGGERSEAYCAEGDGFDHVKEKEYADSNPEELLKSDDKLEIGKGLRMLTGEYGATTKRPRRIGMLDLVMLRQNCKLNGVDELYINKFDCLMHYSKTSLPGIPLVVAYDLDGKKINYMPASVSENRRVKPVVEYVPAFKNDISGIRNYDDLPQEVKDLIKFIEKHVESKVCGIGVGPEREQFVT